MSLAGAVMIYTLAVGMDAASTEYALSRNAREGNPILRQTEVRVAAYVARVGVLTLMDRGIERKWGRSTAKKFRALVVVVHLGVAAWNLRQAGRRD